MVWPFTRPAPAEVVKSLAEPTPQEIEIFTGVPIGSHALGLHQALTVPAVQSAISLISGSIASFDLMVERRDGTAWRLDDKHPVAELLADQPNEWSSTFDLVRDLIATALTNDRGGLAWVNRVDGQPVEIVRYDPGHYQIDYSADGRQEPSYRINNLPVAASDVIHLRGPFSRSPLTLAAEAIGTAKVIETHVANFFKNGARPSGQILSPKPLGDTGVAKMLDGWKRAQQGPGNAGGVPIFWDGTEFKPLAFSSVDAQTLELTKEQTIQIARAFRVPPSMLFEMGRATWANSEQAQKEWLAALELWMQPLEAAMRRALFSADERKSWRIRFDRDDLTAVDLTARATAISSLISSRVLNPNEAREWLGYGLSPYAGGEEYANPNTGASQPGTITPETKPDESDGENDDERNDK